MMFTILLVTGVAIVLTLSSIMAFRCRKKRNQPSVTINEYPLEDIRNRIPIVIPKEYEFSREKLCLLEKIGEGEFGIVRKATAQNILVTEPETVVAVKMVKTTCSPDVCDSLVSELQMLIHVGQHLNVVNFLGAVPMNACSSEYRVAIMPEVNRSSVKLFASQGIS
ncbi:AGAP008813-PA-like protein [Anopheles sinensis]|uniref:AGAP008813-PA-like protein n=1 Tax=Anopheles sinensis TaxID=74873 RepID=A0A084VG71_ANOSI|nr:AGAP008813-PA-like protein [Anopheles sinensis]